MGLDYFLLHSAHADRPAEAPETSKIKNKNKKQANGRNKEAKNEDVSLNQTDT